MVTFLHTSDWHLGRMLYCRSLLEDQEYFLDRVFFPAVEQVRPDAVLLAGDIFDRPVAPVEAVRLFDSVLDRLHRLGIPLAAIAGNHDSPDRLALGAGILRESGVYLATNLDDALTPLRFGKGKDAVDVTLLPYFDPAEARAWTGDTSIRGTHEAACAVLDRVRAGLSPDAAQVLVAHSFVAGSQTCDSETAVSVGGSGEVGLSAFEGFAYVALGHLHGPQAVGKTLRYSGSPLKYSFDEEHHRKSMALVQLDTGRVSVRLLPVQPLREVCSLCGTLGELLAQGEQAPREDYLFCRLTDPVPVYLPAEQLRPYYPNLLSIHCDWLTGDGGISETEPLRRQMRRGKLDPALVLEEFFRQICGDEAAPDETAWFVQMFGQREDGKEDAR